MGAQSIYFYRRVTEAKKRLALVDKLLAIVGKKVRVARKKKEAGARSARVRASV